MIKRLMMLIICMLVVSACDNSASTTTVNRVAGESYQPINLTEATQGTTGMVISGAIDHNTGEVDAFWIRVDRGLDAYRNIEVETRNGYLLRLNHNIDLTEGTHPISFSLDTETLTDNQIAGGLLYLWSPDESEQFTQNPQGDLTIQFIDNQIQGSFSFTVENLAGEQVKLEGKFTAPESDSAIR